MRRVRIAAVAKPRRIIGSMALAGLVPALVLAGGGPASARPANPAPRHAAADVAEHWGYFFGGKERDRDELLSPTPMSLPGRVAEVGSSNSTQYALLTDGTVWAWGMGTRGQLGDGRRVDSLQAAVQVQFPSGVRIASIPTDAMPYDSGLAVDTNGNAWAWGDNQYGSFCQGNDHPYLKPVELPLSKVTLLAGAGGHAVFDANHTLVSCGSNADGVLGDGSMRSSETPVPVRGIDGSQVTELVSAYDNAGALLANGTYDDWGLDTHGQLGNGTLNQPSDVPVQVSFPDASPVTQVAQGGSFPTNGQSIALLADGSVYGWGSDTYYQLGDGRKGMRPSPVQAILPKGVRFTTLATGGGTSYAIAQNGDVYAWGSNSKGQVGDGGTATAQHPVQVGGPATMISSTAGDVLVGGTASASTPSGN